MKTNVTLMSALATLHLLCACADEPTAASSSSSSDDNVSTTSVATEVTCDAVFQGDVSSFTISHDKTALSETLKVDNEDDDYVENTTFDETVYITFSATGDATVEGDTEGSVSVDGNDVTVSSTSAAVRLYVLSGTTNDGFFKLYSNRKQGIKLDGVNITNPDGAAINNQSKKRTFIVLAEGSSNFLTDGTAYADATDAEDMKACLFSEGQLVISGNGYLEVDANCKAGIRSDDYVRFMPGCNVWVDASSGNGIRGNDAVVMTGGVVNVNVTGVAEKGVSTDGDVQIDGGRLTVLTSGGCEWDDEENDYTASAGIKADGQVYINGGEVNLSSSGTGGKGISCDGDLAINAGTVRVITAGSKRTQGNYSTSPKGIKADGAITIAGGDVLVRATGGEGSEGIESKGEMVVTGGTIEGWCYDDVINSKGDLTISGGYVYAHSTNNDAIDSNQNMYINGGVVIAEGAGGAECGIDAAEGYKAYINGGTVVALGGNIQAIDSSSKQASVACTVPTNYRIGLIDGTKAILGYTTPSGNGTALTISSPELKSGTTYTLRGACSFTGGSSFYSLATGCQISSGSTSADVTAATAISGTMGGGMGGPGGRRF
ncbi:MAG: carbohydrate-binding domain-containing protein [Muribaculaceae bacterium]|nr:carbohydrate-binding domain-containing protein [Muribaculaceae bacterium]